MTAAVFLDHRFTRTPDGACWTSTVHPYSFWQRYLSVFDRVNVVARLLDVPSPEEQGSRADGKGVSFTAIPHFVGPWQYLLHAVEARQSARAAIGRQDAVILRVACHTSNLVDAHLRRKRRPYGVEVINDPYDMFSPGAQDTPLRPYLRWSFTRRLRTQCRDACSAAYVTGSALQRRYPPPRNGFSTHYADGELPDSAFLQWDSLQWERPVPKPAGQPPRAVTVAPLGHLNKATDVLIDAVDLCRREGFEIALEVVGDGRCKARLEQQAAALGLQDHVRFTGNVPGPEAVRSYLDAADLFVLPSRHEGLPRAMIEAMARSLPCIGSDAGGIPELLAPEDIVPRNDARALANKLREVLSDPGRMIAMSNRNYRAALRYRDDLVQTQRIEFFRSVRDKTEEWLAKNI